MNPMDSHEGRITSLEQRLRALEEVKGEGRRDALLKEAAEVLDECGNELVSWVENNYKDTKNKYPSMNRRYKRDIEPAIRAIALAVHLRAQEGGGG